MGWKGKSFVAIGMKDPVFGPNIMKPLAKNINCSFQPLIVHSGGHFLQEWGGPIARAALNALKD